MLQICWYEAFGLFVVYLAYCTFMKFNERLEIYVKKHLFNEEIEIADEPEQSAAAMIEDNKGDQGGKVRDNG
jgi:hypothetical protein